MYKFILVAPTALHQMGLRDMKMKFCLYVILACMIYQLRVNSRYLIVKLSKEVVADKSQLRVGIGRKNINI